MNILISACLCGVPCRYDGKDKNSIDLSLLKSKHTLIPVCPEADAGLPIPRAPAEIIEDKVINNNGNDVTAEYMLGAELALKTAIANNCKVAILKARSPSCGKGWIYDGSFSKKLIVGNGITAELLIKNGIEVYTEDEIDKLL